MRHELTVAGRPASSPDQFKTVLRDEVCTMQFDADLNAVASPTSLGGVQTGIVDVLRYTGDGVQWCTRNRDNIRLDRADYYVVCMPEFAELYVRQNGVDARLHPGTFSFISTSQPFHALIRSLEINHTFSALHVRIPGPLLRSRIPNIADICGGEIQICPGTGRMMRSLLDIALHDGPYLPRASNDQLGSLLLDAISNAAAPASNDMAHERSALRSPQRVLNRAKLYIASHLSDASLDPRQIAAHCRVSLRYLHAAFANQSSCTVAAYIRESRLEQCRAALRSPLLRDRTIIQIAGDCGFEDHSHFCHIYKNRFGKTPRQDRHATDA